MLTITITLPYLTIWEHSYAYYYHYLTLPYHMGI